MGIYPRELPIWICFVDNERLNGHEIIPMKLMTITINYIVKLNKQKMANQAEQRWQSV